MEITQFLIHKNAFKWLAYALSMLLIAALQTTPHLFPAISGVRPVLLIPFVIAIAMREGTAVGGVFGALSGLFWDLSGTSLFGFHGLFLMIMGIVVALLVDFAFHSTWFSSLVFSLIFTAVIELIGWFFIDYMVGGQDFVHSFLSIILPSTLYTFAFVFPFYHWVGYLQSRLTE